MNQIRSFDADPAPHSIEAEQQVLGGLLLDNALWDRLPPEFTAADLYDPVHAAIFEAIREKVKAESLASPVTLAAIPGLVGRLDDLGGKRYLVNLAGAASMSAFKGCAEIIQREAIKRRALEAMDSARDDIMGREDAFEPIAALRGTLDALSRPVGRETSLSMDRAITGALSAAWDVRNGAMELAGTGIPALDGIIGGLAADDLMLLGGATSMGKSSVGLHMAKESAVSGKGVVLWSREMSPDSLMHRMISAGCRIPYSRMRDPRGLTEAEFGKVVDASQGVIDLPLRIVPKEIETLDAGEAAIRRAGVELGIPLSLVVVDYAQKVKAEGRSRFEEMSLVADGLKDMAGRLECPVVALVQISRDMANRDNKRPVLTDIKESGQFENNADQVVFCHREEYYLQRQGPRVNRDGEVTAEARADHEADLSRWKNRLELIVAKNRHGEIATAEVGFHPPTNRLWRLGEEQEAAF